MREKKIKNKRRPGEIGRRGGEQKKQKDDMKYELMKKK